VFLTDVIRDKIKEDGVEYIARMKNLRNAFSKSGMLNEESSGGHCYCVLLIPCQPPRLWVPSSGYSHAFMKGHPTHSERKQLRSIQSGSFANNLGPPHGRFLRPLFRSTSDKNDRG
jgi:hypothetical protein